MCDFFCTFAPKFFCAMAAINELIDQIQDVNLRNRILQEVSKLQKQKKFGLIFEDHIPEATLLYDVPIRKGTKVVLRSGRISDCYRVQMLDGDNAICVKLDETREQITCAKSDLVAVAHFGEPIFPYLRCKDAICNAPDSDLWHTLIEADNYHALQLLVYLYGGKVDCIYIDPPYNTGARDWKYNNDYVDGSDSYRHSKWLSMIEKRLKLAKKLLNPKDSVLIVTIDEKEYLHLGCLLEQLFPDATIQMVTSVIKPSGNRRDREFSRCEEYIFYVLIGEGSINSIGKTMLVEGDFSLKPIRLKGLLRQASNHGRRIDRPNLFYPIIFDKQTGKFIRIGDSLPKDFDRTQYSIQENESIMWPIGQDGTELTWGLQPSTFMDYYTKGYIKFGKWDGEKRVGYYMSSGIIKEYENGDYDVLGRDEDGALILERKNSANIRPLTVWNQTSHAAGENGTGMIKKILASNRFSFPKSVYAVKDSISFCVVNKPNALVVDFFAGSGTTLHAVNLLNAEDNGHRRCILVTNNEVSEEEAKELTIKGYKQGDDEWEKLGIANYVTWPRTKCSILGKDINGNVLSGTYTGSDIPMSDGFQANAIFFKLGFLDKTTVSLGRQLKELMPVLWMKAGAKGECPTIKGNEDFAILPANKFAILVNESEYSRFETELMHHPEIEVAYIITNSEAGYREMIAPLKVKETYQLYRDYLDNFSINYSK